MTTIYRCDRCGDLIEPHDADEYTKFTVRLEIEQGENETVDEHSQDYCGDCRPDSAVSFIDWVEYHRGDE